MKRWKRQLLTAAGTVLSDRVMGVLGIVAVASSLYRVIFSVTAELAHVLNSIEWTIVLLFVVEYLVQLTLSGDRNAYFWSGWRLLDLAIIAACLLTILPIIHPVLRGTLVLRLLWIVRAFGLGLRVKNRAQALSLQTTMPTPRAFAVLWQDGWKAQPMPWSDLVEHAAVKSDGWLDAFDVGGRHLEELANSLKLPPALFNILRSTSSYPRLKVFAGRLVATFLLPLIKVDGLERVSVLLSLSEHGPLVTIAPIDCQFQQRLTRWLSPQDGPVESLAVEASFRAVLEQNEEALAHLETGLRQMEEAPVARVAEEFFRQAFRLRRDLAQVKADLWRLGGILDALKTDRTHLPRHSKTTHDTFVILSDQADYLYETASNLGEQLISLIELHTNTISLRVNRFMQLLALVTVLAAIPATVAGMLGMSIDGTPWPVTLGQVAFGVAALVLMALYLFLSGESFR